MGTRGYFFIGTDKNKKFLGFMPLDGYPWQGGGYKPVLASRTENEFRHLATSLGLYPANVLKEYWKRPLTDFEYAYCWDGNKVQIFADGQPFQDDNGEFSEWLQKMQELNKDEPTPIAQSQSDAPIHTLIKAMREVLDRFEKELAIK